MLRALRARGHPVFLERAIIMDHMAKRISDEAFARAGWPVEPRFAQTRSTRNRHRWTLRISSSPEPGGDGLAAGARGPGREDLAHELWLGSRAIPDDGRALPPSEGVTVLFVGGIEIRKGARLLLEVWSRAGIAGRLVLAGEMEPLIARYCGEHLKRKDVIHLPFDPVRRPCTAGGHLRVSHAGGGSPLVSYEALGTALPVVTTPMGAGEIARHGQEGLVVAPHDQDALHPGAA